MTTPRLVSQGFSPKTDIPRPVSQSFWVSRGFSLGSHSPATKPALVAGVCLPQLTQNLVILILSEVEGEGPLYFAGPGNNPLLAATHNRSNP
jgi:hypothetical protein